MPDDNGVNEANKAAKDTGETVDKAAKSSIGKSNNKGKSNTNQKALQQYEKKKDGSKKSNSSGNKLKGKEKWIAILVAAAVSLLCILLASLLIVLMVTSVTVINEANNENGDGLQPIGTFYPRFKTPVKGEDSVNQTGNKVDKYYFNSTNPFEATGTYGMPNCTAYAWSRAYEMLDSPPNLCTGNAQDWYGYNKTYDYYPYGSEPRLGAIAVWSHDDSGHVAVVESINDTTVTFSNSAWNGQLFFLTRINSTEHPNYWDNSSWNFLGFIYVFDEMTSSDPLGGAGGVSSLAAIARNEVNEGPHYGGQKYWSWYGWSYRVEWCACFASYCMNKAGMLTEQAGGGHKTAQAETQWYKDRGHFLAGGKTPSAGMLIFFDWNLDGIPDHVGVVIDSKNSTVYTAEGNHGDRTAFCEYSVSYSCIYGYATFDTDDSVTLTSSKIPSSEKEFCQLFYKYFKKKGYNKAAICGMLGNIYTECSMSSSVYFAGWISDAGGAPGNSGGICQWYGDNCTRFKRDCPNWNKSVVAQFEYLAKTLDNDGQGSYNTKYYYWCTGTKSALKSVPNSKAGAQTAAYKFMELYERPNLGFNQSRRWNKAAEYWDMLR